MPLEAKCDSLTSLMTLQPYCRQSYDVAVNQSDYFMNVAPTWTDHEAQIDALHFNDNLGHSIVDAVPFFLSSSLIEADFQTFQSCSRRAFATVAFD